MLKMANFINCQFSLKFDIFLYLLTNVVQFVIFIFRTMCEFLFDPLGEIVEDYSRKRNTLHYFDSFKDNDTS